MFFFFNADNISRAMGGFAGDKSTGGESHTVRFR